MDGKTNKLTLKLGGGPFSELVTLETAQRNGRQAHLTLKGSYRAQRKSLFVHTTHRTQPDLLRQMLDRIRD